MRYRFHRIDGSIAALVERYNTSLDALWHLNDPDHEHRSAETWARSIRHGDEIDIDLTDAEARWIWDQWTDVPGNPTLAEFCGIVNAERARLQRRQRPVGPEAQPGTLWLSLANSSYRYRVLENEAAAGGSDEYLRALDNDPGAAYIRALDAQGNVGATLPIFVPSQHVAQTAPVAAAPSVDGEEHHNVFEARPHWVHELVEMLREIEDLTESLHAHHARELAAIAESAEVLSTFARLEGFLRVMVEGRSGEDHHRVFASAENDVLRELSVLAARVRLVHLRAVEIDAVRREIAAPRRQRERMGARLRELVESSDLQNWLARATRGGMVFNDELIISRAKNSILEAAKVGLELGMQWAEDAINHAMNPPDAPFRITPLVIALIAPTIGNTAGPPSAWVWIVQFRASRAIQKVLNGQLSPAEFRGVLDTTITRYLGYANTRMTADQYRAWLDTIEHDGREAWAIINAGSEAEWLTMYEAMLRIPPENSLAALRQQIIATVVDTGRTVEERREALEQIARGDLTANVHTDNRTSGFMVVMNLAVLGMLVANYFSTAPEDRRTLDLIVASLGPAYTGTLAGFQILSNVRGETSMWARVLRNWGTELGHVAAFLSFFQACYGVWAEYDQYGLSHPQALWLGAFSIGSSVLLWGGWYASLGSPLWVGIGSALTGFGIGFAIGVAAISLFMGEDDPPTKGAFVELVHRFAGSQQLLEMNAFMIEQLDAHPNLDRHDENGRIDIRSEVAALEGFAQRTRFTKVVHEERDNLAHLGFGNYLENLIDTAPRIYVGPVWPMLEF